MSHGSEVVVVRERNNGKKAHNREREHLDSPGRQKDGGGCSINNEQGNEGDSKHCPSDHKGSQGERGNLRHHRTSLGGGEVGSGQFRKCRVGCPSVQVGHEETPGGVGVDGSSSPTDRSVTAQKDCEGQERQTGRGGLQFTQT